jgi:extracellular factor (EF) 3-hydroxypalmitic acid methyl ester biosynthesis protein
LNATLENGLRSDLAAHVGEITGLDPTLAGSPAEAMHRACAAYHGLLASVAAAEAAGLPRASINEILAPVLSVLRSAPFFQRTYDWPRGYAGDFETVEYLCFPQQFCTSGQSFADVVHDYVLTSQATQQHRNKIVKQALMVLETAVGSDAGTRILSAACGGCPDLRMVLPMLRGYPGTFVLVDTDADALSYARGELGPLAEKCEFVHQNAMRYVRQAAQRGEKFDLVYAGGLFDYLTDDKVSFIVRTAWEQLLKPGGRLLFTNLAREHLHRYTIEYGTQWQLILRSEQSVLDLCGRLGIDASRITIERDSTGVTLLVELRRERDE